MGMDLIGPLPETTRGNKYIVTVTDYFSKWAEAAPLPSTLYVHTYIHTYIPTFKQMHTFKRMHTYMHT